MVHATTRDTAMTVPTRREFLSATAAGAAALAIPSAATARSSPPLGSAKSCIFINMVGGPSHIDTFDPKPNAPSEVRGPFQPIQTKTPGLHLSELFPKLAGLTDKFSLIRSMHHTAPPIHEAGFQLLNTGRLFRDGPEWPNVGCVMDHLFVRKCQRMPSWSVWPNTEISTGISIGHGLNTGWLNVDEHSPCTLNPPWLDCPRASFDWCCHIAIGINELDCRFLTINQFSTVFDSPSWDCHADGGSLRTDLNDIRNTVAPSFDTAFAALLTSLEERGLLDTTLVVATGEFGRTPLLNANGGRDHWAGAWTALVAGGGTQGGRVIGRTDAKGTEPIDRPVTPQELVASIFHAMGVSHDATIPGPDGKLVAVYPGVPVMELF
ncbi:MAG: DUF1501 domain-containing protein [Planctomycetaceae bacterium]|nr:DUF1501 domain-containing protein [Planctomycetaceae bacterium]